MSARHIELPSELPIEYEARPDAQIFWVMCGCSVVFGAPGALALLHLVTDAHSGGDIVSALIIGSFFTLVGLLFVFLAYSARRFRESLRITREAVHRERQLLFGLEVWSEPMSLYHGVLMSESEETTGGRVSRSRSSRARIFTITLKHRNDENKDITLYRTESDDCRDKAVAYARVLHAPLLTAADSGQFNEIAFEQLDSALVEQLAAPSAREAIKPYKPIADPRLTVEPIDHGYQFTYTLRDRGQFSTWLFLLGLAFAANSWFGWFSVGQWDVWFAWLTGPFCAIGAVGLLASQGTQQVLEATPRALHFRVIVLGKTVRSMTLQAHEIVSIDTELLARQRPCLTIRTTARTHHFAKSAGAAARESARETLLGVLSRSPEARNGS